MFRTSHTVVRSALSILATQSLVLRSTLSGLNTSQASFRSVMAGSRAFSINLSTVNHAESEKKPIGYEDFKITDKGVAQLKHLQEQFGPNTILRVLVDTGGCSGFQYNYIREQMEDPKRYAYDSSAPRMIRVGDDYVFQRDGVTVLVDDVSMPFLVGAQLDYVTEMIRSAFQVTNNPNVELACGCGTSFSKKK